MLLCPCVAALEPGLWRSYSCTQLPPLCAVGVILSADKGQRDHERTVFAKMPKPNYNMTFIPLICDGAGTNLLRGGSRAAQVGAWVLLECLPSALLAKGGSTLPPAHRQAGAGDEQD